MTVPARYVGVVPFPAELYACRDCGALVRFWGTHEAAHQRWDDQAEQIATLQPPGDD